MSEDTSPIEWWKHEKTILAIRDFALLQGLIKRSSDDPNDLSLTNVAVTLTPHKFPLELFQHARSIQKNINVLVDAVSRDYEFLSGILESVNKRDDFTRRLFEIYTKVHTDNRQTCDLCIQRSDYMIDYDPSSMSAPSLKQIEMNTISVSCFGLTQGKMSELHRFVKSRFNPSQDDFNIPENNCLNVMTDGIARAWEEYRNPNACVLFMTTAVESNLYDTRPIEYLLWNKYGIRVVYMTLLEVSQQGRLGSGRELIVSDQEVAVVYYRVAYSPDHYPTEKEWDTRLMCEMSLATNCPSVAYQLAGTKKVQQSLAMPGILEKFISDPVAAADIRATFAGLYSLQTGPEGDSAIEMALKNPARFVVKPQREGGGNNFYDDDVCTLLQDIKSTNERDVYILMDRIRPPTQPGLILKTGSTCVELQDLTCELGILGVYLRNKDETLVNKEGGYILRTKPRAANEGGLLQGAGSLDLPNLVSSQMSSAITKLK